jgi:hypothetical protein
MMLIDSPQNPFLLVSRAFFEHPLRALCLRKGALIHAVDRVYDKPWWVVLVGAKFYPKPKRTTLFQRFYIIEIMYALGV